MFKRALIATLIVAISYCLFANITGTVVTNNNQINLQLISVKLMTSTNTHVSETHPNSNGLYTITANPGTYYIKFELYQPSTNQYCYPFKSAQFTYVNSYQVATATLQSVLVNQS